MAGKSAILAIRIIGDAKGAVKALDDTGDSAKGLGGKLGAMVPGIAAIGTAVVGAGIAAGKALFDLGARFDEVEDTIRVGTGATGEALDGLVDVAHNIATSIPASFEDAGQTVADLNTRLGLSGDTLKTVASQYLEAGRILGEDVDINKTTAAFSAFGIEGERVEGAMDTLFRVSQATGVGMNVLAGTMQDNALTLKELGFSFEDSAALIGVLDKAGVDASGTLNAMRKGMLNLAEPGESTASAFQRVVGELQGYISAGDTAAALDVAEQVFGTRGAAQMVQALQTGTFSIEDLTAAAGVTGDTILGVGRETMDAAEKWEILKNRGLEALEPLASAVFDGVGAAMDWISEKTEGLSFDTFLEAAPWIGDLATATIDLAESFGGLLGPVVEKLGPIVLLFAQTVGTCLTDLFTLISNIVTFVSQIVSGDWAGAWDTAGKIVDSARTLIVNYVTNLGALVSTLVQNAVTWMRDSWSNGWASLSGVARDKAGEVVSWVTATFLSLPGRLTQAGVDAIRGFINGMTSMGTSLWNAATDMANNAVDAIKSRLGIHSPSRVGMTLGAYFGQGVALGITGSTPAVDRAATAMVSTIGPNLAPVYAARFAPVPQAQPVSITVNVSGVLDGADAARKIKRLLEDHARGIGFVNIGARA